jgi:putative ABC transport system ATP-binding protein
VSADLRLDGLTVEYLDGGVTVRPIDRLSADVGAGSVLLLVGPSGSGKTTLLSCLAGILSPTSGTISFGDLLVSGLQGRSLTDYRRSTVGVVFQAFNLVPSLSALENVMAPLLAARVRSRPAAERASDLLQQVGLSDRLQHHPGQLSGGQQQRVAIARALVNDPPLLLADEPTAHLDHVQVSGVLGLLRGLVTPDRVIIVATHDPRVLTLSEDVLDLGQRDRPRREHDDKRHGDD